MIYDGRTDGLLILLTIDYMDDDESENKIEKSI